MGKFNQIRGFYWAGYSNTLVLENFPQFLEMNDGFLDDPFLFCLRLLDTLLCNEILIKIKKNCTREKDRLVAFISLLAEGCPFKMTMKLC